MQYEYGYRTHSLHLQISRVPRALQLLLNLHVWSALVGFALKPMQLALPYLDGDRAMQACNTSVSPRHGLQLWE